MYKPRIVFPFTEAGLGHIVPLNAIADAFEKAYGDKTEVIRSNFFTESNRSKLKLFENRLKREVVRHNKHSSYGYFFTLNMELLRTKFSTFLTMNFLAPGTNKEAFEHMKELKPDLVVSTHWATNYYAMNIDPRPLTVTYVPDTYVNPMFSYPCDLVMSCTPTGLDKALKEHPVRFNEENIIHVPYAIRQAAFSVEGKDKKELRIKNGLDPDKFTVMLAEGGYGIGKMEKICRLIIDKNLPVNLVPVCGKNEKLYQEFSTWKTPENVVFHPLSNVGDSIFEYMAASDVFCGKAGSMLSELTFFGVPQIITKYATLIEKNMAHYYLDYVKSAIKIFDEQAVVEKIEEFMSNPESMNEYVENAKKQRSNYGAEVAATKIFEVLCKRFPYLTKDET